MADDEKTQLSFDDLKNQINELRQARKLQTIRLNAGLKYVSTKISEESKYRESIHNSILNNISTAQSEIEKERECK